MSPPRLRHLAVNAVFLQPRMGGMVTYASRLLEELVRLRPDLRVTVFVSESGRPALAAEPWAAGVELVSHPALGRRYVSALSEVAVLPALVGRTGADLLHSLAMTGPLEVSAPHVVTVPDLIWRRFPSSGRVTVAIWRALVPPVARRAQRVITISEASARDIVEILGVDRGRIDVVPLAADEPVSGHDGDGAAAVRERHDLGDGPVVLSVSSKKPHKNLLRLTDAMGAVRGRHPGAVLVIPGSADPHDDELRDAAGRSGARVVLPGWLADADLEALYAAADVVAFPSLQEGFGLPVLEAMRHGVPVATSNVSAMPEVGGDAVRYFDPTDAGDIAGAIGGLLDDPAAAAALAAAGRERARGFTWSAVAERHLESYERALAGEPA